MSTRHQTILARAADDLDQIVDDLDLAARLAPADQRMAIAARALQAHEMAAALRSRAGVAGVSGRRRYLAVSEADLASIGEAARELAVKVVAAYEYVHHAEYATRRAGVASLDVTQASARIGHLIAEVNKHVGR